MTEKEFPWMVKLDWLNVLNHLGLDSIIQISEIKIDKAIRKLSRTFGNETLSDLECDELDQLVANELKDSMRKELTENEKKKEKLEREIKSKIIPFKQGGIIKIDPRDFKDIKDVDPNGNPEDILKAIYKKLMGASDDDDEEEDDKSDSSEDNTGYYI
jgi:hypothetical protein